ncbi:TOBE domain-containing protein [Tessaracoccus sp. Z1128]
MADRVGVMREGRLEQLSDPRELYERPANEFVAQFIGSTNRVHGQVEGGRVKVLGEWVPTLPGSVTEGSGVALVRPERLSLMPLAHADATGAQGFEATIRQLSFLGDHARVYVTLHDDTELQAYLHARAAQPLAQGDRVLVTVDQAPVLVIE